MTATLRSLTIALAICLAPAGHLVAQDFEELGEYKVDWGGYLFGIKGGLSLGNQDWSNLETELLPAYHGAVYYETIPAGGRFSFYGQLGYHVRGSKISRRRAFTFGGERVTLPADDFQFHNISLGVGGKSVVKYARLADLYYTLGLRVEYSLSNNLGKYDALTNTTAAGFRNNYPIDSPDFVNSFVYGASFGGGALFPIGETKSGFIEITAQPDLAFQYEQGPLNNVIDPFSSGNRSISARMIRNFTIEVSVGIRFLRKWTFVD